MSTCAAKGCFLDVGPRHLMCFNHWEMIAEPIRYRIAHAPTPGEKRRAIVDAIKDVMEKEARVR